MISKSLNADKPVGSQRHHERPGAQHVLSDGRWPQERQHMIADQHAFHARSVACRLLEEAQFLIPPNLMNRIRCVCGGADVGELGRCAHTDDKLRLFYAIDSE